MDRIYRIRTEKYRHGCNKLFLTGGKSSHTEDGEIKFVYSSDVWAMERKSE
jgi:hypothetical protein